MPLRGKKLCLQRISPLVGFWGAAELARIHLSIAVLCFSMCLAKELASG